jgi:hypothetical protein
MAFASRKARQIAAIAIATMVPTASVRAAPALVAATPDVSYLEGNRKLPMVSDSGRPQRPRPSDVLPPPRDPDMAVREEFALARASNDPAVLALFIHRHADHPLADEARRLLNALRKHGGH